MKRTLPRPLVPMFGSTRISSCRQLVCCAGEALKVKSPGWPLVGLGIITNIGTALGSTVTELFGKPVRVPLCAPAALAGQSVKTGTFFNAGSSDGACRKSVPGVGHSSLKSPARSASDGTGVLKLIPGTTSLRHSCDQKKNVFVLSWL